MLGLGFWLVYQVWVMVLAERDDVGNKSAPPPVGTTRNVAVIGAGAAGMTAAWAMHLANAVHGRQAFNFTVFESRAYVGGKAATHKTMAPQYPAFPTADGKPPLDLGFIFGHPEGYLAVKMLMAWHGVDRCRSELSITAPTAETGSPIWTTESHYPEDNGIYERKPPASALAEIQRFQDLAQAAATGTSLLDGLMPFKMWLDKHDFSDTFFQTYIFPAYALLFICKTGMTEMPAGFMLKMFSATWDGSKGHHPWLQLNGPAGQVWTACNGSSLLYRNMYNDIGAESFKLSTPVTRVTPDDTTPTVCYTEGGTEKCDGFDQVIIASPGDRTKAMLDEDKDSFWRQIMLKMIRYEATDVVVHSDRGIIAPVTNESSLWKTFIFDPSGGVTDTGAETFLLTGVTRRFTQIAAPYQSDDLFISLNAGDKVKAVAHAVDSWEHQTQDGWHLLWTRLVIPRTQNVGKVILAGDWTGLIGHNDAISSGIAAAINVGVATPGNVTKQTVSSTTWWNTTAENWNAAPTNCRWVSDQDYQTHVPNMMFPLCTKEDALFSLIGIGMKSSV